MTSDLLKVDIRMALGLPYYERQPIMIKCREHQDDKESCAVYSDGIKCFGCDLCIPRRMDALAYLLYEGKYDDRTVRRLVCDKQLLARYSTNGHTPRPEQESRNRAPLPTAYAKIYEDILRTTRANRREWFYRRGLTDRTIRMGRLGHAGTAFSIPVFGDRLELRTFRFRQDFDITGQESPEGRPFSKYYGLAGRNHPVLYPLNLVKKSQPHTAYVVEGELDTLRLWQEGIPAVTVTNGANNMQRVPEMLKTQCESVHSLVIVGDMDERGRVASALCYKSSTAHGFDTKKIEWEEKDGKDITEFMLKGRRLWRTPTMETRASWY